MDEPKTYDYFIPTESGYHFLSDDTIGFGLFNNPNELIFYYKNPKTFSFRVFSNVRNDSVSISGVGTKKRKEKGVISKAKRTQEGIWAAINSSGRTIELSGIFTIKNEEKFSNYVEIDIDSEPDFWNFLNYIDSIGIGILLIGSITVTVVFLCCYLVFRRGGPVHRIARKLR